LKKELIIVRLVGVQVASSRKKKEV